MSELVRVRPDPQGSLLYIDKYLSTPLFLLYAETTRLFIRGDSNNRLSFVYFKEKSFVTSGKLVCPFHFNRDHTVFAFHDAARPSARRRISRAASSTAAQNEFQIVIFYLDYTFYYQIVRQYHGNRFGIPVPAPSGAARPHQQLFCRAEIPERGALKQPISHLKK